MDPAALSAAWLQAVTRLELPLDPSKRARPRDTLTDVIEGALRNSAVEAQLGGSGAASGPAQRQPNQPGQVVNRVA